MSKPIKIDQFVGMNNIKTAESLRVGKAGNAQPRIILNADVAAGGRLIKREGSTKIIDLTNPHSGWSGVLAIMCVAEGYLYRIQQRKAVQICAITGPDTQMFYTDVVDKIYISNKYWNKIFDPATNTVADWGMTLPEQPVVSSTAGNLPAGIYKLCFTKISGREISGNGPITEIKLEANHGISIANRPASGFVWMTDPNDSKFFPVGEMDTIVNVAGSAEPLPSFLCSPPPFMEYLAYAFGRIWGFVEKDLYYSEPLHPEWFRLQFNKFELDQRGTMIAWCPTGLFIGCEEITYFFEGTEPHQMKPVPVGSGAIPETLHYCNNVPELGDILSPAERIHSNVPVWVSQEGIVAGNASGRLFNLTQQKIKFRPGQRGASVHRIKDGEFQFLTSFKQGAFDTGFGMSDAATVEVIRKGRVLEGNWSDRNSDGVGFGDSVELEVNP